MILGTGVLSIVIFKNANILHSWFVYSIYILPVTRKRRWRYILDESAPAEYNSCPFFSFPVVSLTSYH